MLDKINRIDTELFIIINSKHNAFWDTIMLLASDKFFWFPFYLVIIIILIKTYKKKSIIILLSIAFLVLLCDQTASKIIKPLVKRLRPSHNPELENIIHLSKTGAGGMYGFVSSHAANTIGLVTFLVILLPNRFNNLKTVLIFWAILVSYSRIYNGVHYPLDIIGGGLIGLFYGRICYFVYNKYIIKK